MSESFLKGVELVNAAGDKHLGEDVAHGKVLALYFAADWCPDCRAFQPALNAFYDKVNADERQFEIVFVGSDRSEEDQLAHFRDKQGPWWMVPFANELRGELKRMYGVCLRREQEALGVTDIKAGIPALVLAEQNGGLIQLFTDADLETNGLAPVEELLRLRQA